MKLLALIDTPTENTGFACVGRNTLKHWQPDFERIDIWGINYNGWPHEYPYRIYPAGRHWASLDNLKRLLRHIENSDYTHLWILQDSFLLSDNNFPKVLRDVCTLRKIRIITYYPVDAPLESQWLDIVRQSHVAATYTAYGAAQTCKVDSNVGEIAVIPHGVDTEVFRPLKASYCAKLREEFFPDWRDSVIMVNVNRNERRKAMVHSLQVLRELITIHGPVFKLYLHCQASNPNEGLNLYAVSEQLGLQYGKDWLAPDDDNFARGLGRFSSQQINEVYNAADLCITTSLGEGWGLSITEAAAAGLVVVGPRHTSLPDIAKIIDGDQADSVGARIHLVPCIETGVTNSNDNSRVRYPVNIRDMAERIALVAQLAPRQPLSEEARLVLGWERIANEWRKFF